MARPTRRIRTRATRSAVRATLAGLSIITSATVGGAQQAAPAPSVRAENAVIAAAIVRGTDHSPTFRRLVEGIGAAGGLVYVLEGRCGQGIRACLHMSIELAGPFRLLRVLVDVRRAPGCELTVSIGHELQHALEALRDPRITTSAELWAFFHQIGQGSNARRFETAEALAAGVAVEKEICRRPESR